MSTGADCEHGKSCLQSHNFVQIFRTFGLAIHPSKLALAWVATALTWLWGSVLDRIWVAADAGVNGQGIFKACCDFQPMPPDLSAMSGMSGPPVLMCPVLGGAGWMLTQHPWYALLFIVGCLLIWSLFGGAICRIAAVQFARDEKIGLGDSLSFVKQRYVGGFLLAPLLPVFIVLLVSLMLAVGGLFLRIPWLGDVVGSLLFVFAILGGAVIAFVVLGALVGGSLFWPTVAAEGSESLDAVSRSFNYIFAKPWHTVFYALVAFVYGSLCFLFVKLIAYMTLAATHCSVGLWCDKLDRLWTMPSFGELLAVSEQVSGIEHVSRWVIVFWVFLVVVAVWAFLASFWLSASTVIWFLLRKENDAVDLEDVYLDTYEETEYTPVDQLATPEPQPPATPAPAADETPKPADEPPPPSAADDQAGDDGDSAPDDEERQD